MAFLTAALAVAAAASRPERAPSRTWHITSCTPSIRGHSTSVCHKLLKPGIAFFCIAWHPDIHPSTLFRQRQVVCSARPNCRPCWLPWAWCWGFGAATNRCGLRGSLCTSPDAGRGAKREKHALQWTCGINKKTPGKRPGVRGGPALLAEARLNGIQEAAGSSPTVPDKTPVHRKK